MLLGPLPRQTPRAAAASAPDGSAAEDPFPSPSVGSTSSRAGSRTPAHPVGARAALACCALPLAQSDLTVTLAATVRPLEAGLCLLSILLAGFGTLAATSLGGYSPSLLKQLEEDGDEGAARLANDLSRHDREYLVVAFTYTAIGWVAGLRFLDGAVDAANQTIGLALFLGLMLLLGGSLPVAVAHARAERTLLTVLPLVRTGWWLLRWPLVLPLLAITRLGLYLIGVRTRPAPDTAEVQKQILAAVEDSTSDLPLADAERTWIGNIVGLKDLQVSTIMTPRPDIVAFPESMPLREVIEQALEQGFSRYPIYRERIDEIIGVFYVKDALKLLHTRHTAEIDGDLGSMLREPLFVPETMGAAQLLHRFQAGNLHMAIVLDEYGTTAGIVSVEDVLEEIVGEIGDEYDSPVDGEVDPEQIRVLEEGKVLEIPARATVADLNEMLDAQLPDDGDWETVAGMVIAAVNHIPKVDEVVQIHGVEFRVLDADERRLKRLRVTTLVGTAKDAG